MMSLFFIQYFPFWSLCTDHLIGTNTLEEVQGVPSPNQVFFTFYKSDIIYSVSTESFSAHNIYWNIVLFLISPTRWRFSCFHNKVWNNDAYIHIRTLHLLLSWYIKNRPRKVCYFWIEKVFIDLACI